MRCSLFVALAVAAALALAAPARAQDDTFHAGGSVDPKIVAIAKEWFYRFQSGKIDRSQLDVRVNRELTDALIRQEAAALKPFGKATGFYYAGMNRVQYATGYYFTIVCAGGKIVEAVALDADGKIGGINFKT